MTFFSRPWRFGDEVALVEVAKSPLPVGVTEFHQWSDRIIAASGLEATPRSLKFSLANILINLPPTTASESDQYFVNCLRKAAANQVADAMRQEIREEAKKDLEKQNQGEATPPAGGDGELLENQGS